MFQKRNNVYLHVDNIYTYMYLPTILRRQLDRYVKYIR